MIKAVFVDIDNTLLDFNESSKQAIEKSFIENGLPFSNATHQVFVETNEVLWKMIERGEFTREQLHKERFNMILKKVGLSYNGEKIEQSFLNHLYDTAILIDGALDLVEYLSKKYIVCTASNAPHDQQINRLKTSKIHPFVSHIFTSESMCADKPSDKFFCNCFEKLNGVLPSETCMIGDSLTADIAGAKRNGMATIWFNFTNQPLPKITEYDHLVYSLNDIKGIL